MITYEEMWERWEYHIKKAEEQLELATSEPSPELTSKMPVELVNQVRAMLITKAQVHATLALAYRGKN